MARKATITGRNPYGPQEPQADAPENIGKSQIPQFYECGCCGHCHPASWNGDCRDDNNRFTHGELDEKYGAQDTGWEEVAQPGSEE